MQPVGRVLLGLTVTVLAAATACGPGPGTADRGPDAGVKVLAANPERCVESYDPGVDYFPDKAAPEHAEGFSVRYFRHYKVLKVVIPDNPRWTAMRDQMGIEHTYVLRQCGTADPEGWPSAWPGAVLVDVPVRTVVTTSTTVLPHLAGLGVEDSLVGHDRLAWVDTPSIRHRIEAGKVVEVGNFYAGDFDVEKVAALRPDILLASEINPAQAAQLRAAGTAVVVNPEYFETSPLGKAEWMLFTALFFNREARAAAVLAPVLESYGELAARARSATPRPTVMSGGLFDGDWISPGGESAVARLIYDAGADYLWADKPYSGFLKLPLQDALAQARQADVWIHPSTWHSLAEIRAADPRLGELAVARSGRIYQNDARLAGALEAAGTADDTHVGNAYFELGMSRPDLVLADLVTIFHPELLPGHRLVFHRRLTER